MVIYNRFFTKEIGGILIFIAWVSLNYFESNYQEILESLSTQRESSFHYKSLISKHRILFYQEKTKENINLDSLKLIYKIIIELQIQSLNNDGEVKTKGFDKNLPERKISIQNELGQILCIEETKEFIFRADKFYNELNQESAANSEKIDSRYRQIIRSKSESNKVFLWTSILGFLLYGFNHAMGLILSDRNNRNQVGTQGLNLR
jgi:hypothetical protein